MNYIRLAQILGTLAVIAALAAGAFHFIKDWKQAHRDAAAYADCRAWAAKPTRIAGSGALCAAPIRAAIQSAAMAETCDAALVGGDKTRFAMQQACSGPVKLMVAQRDARADEVVDRDKLITQLKGERRADVARAESRGRDTGKRETRDAKIIAAAPRDPSGRVRCDADCLRALAN